MQVKKFKKAFCCFLAALLLFFAGCGNKPLIIDGFDTSADFVKFLDVGQGDSILIYSNGYSALIDTGLASYSADVINDLGAAKIDELDVVLITHLHMDHAAGIAKIAEIKNIKNLILPKPDSDAEAAGVINAARDYVTASGGSCYTATQGLSFNIGEFEITLLAYYDSAKGENNRSVIAMAELDGVKFLLTGDAETETERKMLSEGLNIDCDVLKVGHHGSNSSSTKTFLKSASPTYAAISVGEGNMYSHPSKKVTDALKGTGAEVYRTDKQGDITFFVEKGEIRVETEE